MSKRRVTVSQREAAEAARGRQAFEADSTSTVDRQPSTVEDQRSTAEGERLTVDGVPSTWEDSHKRVTFYCPSEVLAAIEREMGRSGRSKSRVIVDALREHLQ